jgi:hypothetical protein
MHTEYGIIEYKENLNGTKNIETLNQMKAVMNCKLIYTSKDAASRPHVN